MVNSLAGEPLSPVPAESRAASVEAPKGGHRCWCVPPDGRDSLEKAVSSPLPELFGCLGKEIP